MSTGISTGPNLLQSEVENPDASMRYGSVNTQVADKQVPDAYAIAETAALIDTVAELSQ